jgi:hypothetical protein
VYLNVMLALGVTSVFLTICVLNIHFKPEDENITGYCRTFVKLSSNVFCWNEASCCKKGKRKISAVGVTEKQNEVGMQKLQTEIQNLQAENDDQPVTWKEVAKKMDRFLFIMYASVFVFFTVIFVILMIIGSSM